MSRPRGIFICVPAGGQMVTAQTMESIFSTGQWLTSNGINNQLCWFAASDIEEIRNLFLTSWYDTLPHFSHLLSIDSDMGFSPLLIRDMLRFDKPVTGCIYAKRQAVPSVVGCLPAGHSTKDVVNGFMKTTRMGAGVLLIKRQVVDVMLQKMPEISRKMPAAMAGIGGLNLTRIVRAFDKIDDGAERLSEDISFCERWTQCGGEIWANVEHKISHIGPFNYCLRYGGILEAKEVEEAEEQKAEAA